MQLTAAKRQTHTSGTSRPTRRRGLLYCGLGPFLTQHLWTYFTVNSVNFQHVCCSFGRFFFSPFVMGSPPKFHSNVLPISTIVKSFLFLTATTTNKTYFVIWNGKCQFVFGLLHNGTASPPTPTFHLREFKISTFHASSKLTCSSQAASHFI